MFPPKPSSHTKRQNGAYPLPFRNFDVKSGIAADTLLTLADGSQLLAREAKPGMRLPGIGKLAVIIDEVENLGKQDTLQLEFIRDRPSTFVNAHTKMPLVVTRAPNCENSNITWWTVEPNEQGIDTIKLNNLHQYQRGTTPAKKEAVRKLKAEREEGLRQELQRRATEFWENLQRT